MVSRGCPTREKLRAYSLGHISSVDQAVLWEHLCECSACLTVLTELEGEIDPLVSAVTRASSQPSSAEVLGDQAVYYQGFTRTKALVGSGCRRCVGPDVDDALAETRQEMLGQYELMEELGRGGMGVVYKARHTCLDKIVALKILYGSRLENAVAVDRFLRETKAVGRLNHPSIVQATDAGEVEGAYYLAMEFVPGENLSRTLRGQRRLPVRRSVEVIRDVARGLQHAHQRGLVHRDIKPSNILLESSGRVRITDFGLVLAENDLSDNLAYAGTPAYMSPEQARGEGHRVDGRSDIFSLGAVFYRLLTGQQPFRGHGVKELCERIASGDLIPPRMIDPSLPEELERICLKALKRDPARRYETAGEMADDLDCWLCHRERLNRNKLVSGTGYLEIVPKGLHPYDTEDTSFFLGLVPGPRDASGLPSSIRFWKRRIERTVADKSFRIGVLRGPNGCGKTSLIRAGLLPNLGNHVTSIHLVATGRHTEAALAAKLRENFASIADNFAPDEVLAEAKRLVAQHPDAKILIVLDQFEQWLQANHDFEGTALSGVLQLCDGQFVQCLLVVRDELWASTKRFMRENGFPLDDGVNCASVELLDLDHARGVLAAYGRAKGALPSHAGDQTNEHIQFFDRAIAGLAEDGVVSPMRLTMFAETIKSVLWTPAQLRRIGGVHGVGVAFLRAVFDSTSGRRKYRRHQQAARAVLAALCPDRDVALRETASDFQRLLEVSGYSDSPQKFEELLSILNHHLKLISLVDPEDLTGAEGDKVSDENCRFYRLSHAYLAPIVRAWTDSEKKRTLWERVKSYLTKFSTRAIRQATP